MVELAEFNSWLKSLECPQSYTTNYVKKTLHNRVHGLLWEDLPKFVRPLSEVAEVRKNILLYKLKHEPKDSLIQGMRNTIHIKEERRKLDAKIKTPEEKWTQQELLCRQKAHLLERKKIERQALEIKKEILKIKHEQMMMQIKDCAKMQEICQHFMPPTIEEISQSTIIDCLSLASNYSGGPEKRKVWNKISESLNHIKIQVLWNAMLQARSNSTDFLIQLDIEENQDSSNKAENSIDVGIAKMCSEHLDNIAKRFIHSGRMQNNEQMTIEYVKKIEQIIDMQRLDLGEWLPLALEVRKLEIRQNELSREIEKLRLEEKLPIDDTMINDNLMQLITEIKIVDGKTANCVQEIQNAFGLLKSSGMLIMKSREDLVSELEKLQILQSNEENQWINIDLHTDLCVFYNNIDVNALRKIMLKGETGAYKHLQTCFNRASVVDIQNKSGQISNFPMLRMSIYYLIDLYKTFITNATLTMRINEDIIETHEYDLELPHDFPPDDFSNRGLLELLRLTDVACNKTLQHREEFDKVLKTWSNQTVREVVSKVFCDKNVYGATLDEWQKRFAMRIYVLQKSNRNVV